MLKSKRKIFRNESLERLSSPEALDQLMKVVSPKSLLPLAAFGTIAITGIAWSFLGRIPVTVEGQGILIYPSNITPLQLASAGQIGTLTIKANDIVKKGQIIGTIDLTELIKQLQQQTLDRMKLAGQQLEDLTTIHLALPLATHLPIGNASDRLERKC